MKNDGTGKGLPFYLKIKESLKKTMDKKREDRKDLILDIIILLIGVVFARAHVIFGAYPLSLSLVCALPRRVWVALLGAILGALSLGQAGIIYAMLYLVCVILRLIISLPKKEDNFDDNSENIVKCKESVVKNACFNENIFLRTSVAIIGAFVAGVYEVLLSGLSFTTLAFAVSMIAVSAVATLVFCALFIKNTDVISLFFDAEAGVSFDTDEMNYKSLIFGISILFFSFLLGLSLMEYQLFGISLSYIFTSLALVVSAKRFGAFAAGAIAFASSLGISGTAAVAFALGGLGAGFVFPFGTGYALTVGALSLSAFSAYTEGVVGLVSVLPEYIIGALLSLTVLNGINASKPKENKGPKQREATDMVGTMALSYRDKREDSLISLRSTLLSLSKSLKRMAEEDYRCDESDYLLGITDALEQGCGDCNKKSSCLFYSEKHLRAAARELEMEKDGSLERLIASCKKTESVGGMIKRNIAKIKQNSFEGRELLHTSGSFDFFAKFLSEDAQKYRQSCEVDEPMSEKVEKLLKRHGLKDGVGRVFGQRERYVIIAGDDKTGGVISDPDLHTELSKTIGVSLSSPQYYRKGDMALMECHADNSYILLGKGVGVARRGGKVSGDKMSFVDTLDGYSLALLTDGMGTGKSAKRVSDFASEIIGELLKAGRDKTTSLHLLNKLLNERRDESSVALDLFMFDKILGEGMFIKSGSAPSYIKRGSSVFRIKSETAPLGSLPSLDCEKIRVEVKEGDFVIMLSDGVSQSAEDTPWLLDFLSKPYTGDESTLANDLLELAKQNRKSDSDDMSVLVATVKKNK